MSKKWNQQSTIKSLGPKSNTLTPVETNWTTIGGRSPQILPAVIFFQWKWPQLLLVALRNSQFWFMSKNRLILCTAPRWRKWNRRYEVTQLTNNTATEWRERKKRATTGLKLREPKWRQPQNAGVKHRMQSQGALQHLQWKVHPLMTRLNAHTL